VKSAYDRGSTGVTDAATAQTTADAAVAGTAYGTSQFGSSGVIGTHPSFTLTTNGLSGNGTINHTRIIPFRNITVSNIAMINSSVGGTPTLVRFGIYTRSGTTFTLVARTASDTTIFNAANTKFTRALNTTGGYPATYTMTAGTEYFISVIFVGTPTPSLLQATARLATAANAATGVQYYSQTSQSDLVTSSTGTASTTISGIYAEVS
jgi:hypothetical protein